MRNYFQIADKSNDNKVNMNEITRFLESINLKLRKDQLRSMIHVFIYLLYVFVKFLENIYVI